MLTLGIYYNAVNFLLINLCEFNLNERGMEMYKNDNGYKGYEFNAKSKRQSDITKNQLKLNAHNQHEDFVEGSDAYESKNERAEKQMQDLKRILRIMSDTSPEGDSNQI